MVLNFIPYELGKKFGIVDGNILSLLVTIVKVRIVRV